MPPVEEALANYVGLHESTGESFESMADRVEAQGAKVLADRLRKQQNYSDRFKENEKIRAAGAREADTARDSAPAARRGPDAGRSTT